MRVGLRSELEIFLEYSVCGEYVFFACVDPVCEVGYFYCFCWLYFKVFYIHSEPEVLACVCFVEFNDFYEFGFQ